ncbi:MAG: SGNH/GDSL hydrolase family protein [Leptolinea sp.]
MKKFAIRLILLVLPFAISFVLLDRALENVYPNSYKLKRVNLEKNLNVIEVLVLGDSWAWNDINPDYFQVKGYNLANPVQDLYYDQQLLYKYLDHLPNLKVVLQPLSYHILQSNQMLNGRNYRVCMTLREFSILPQDLEDLFRYRFCSLLTKEGDTPFSSILYWEKNLKNYDLPSTVQENGWGRNDAVLQDTSLEGAGKRVLALDKAMDPTLMEGNIQRLLATNQKLKNRGVKLVLLTLPVTKEFYTNINLKKYNAVQKQILQLSKQNNIPYYDYIQDSRFSDEDFYNYDHMNPRGAEKISRILDSEVIQPAVNPGK